MGDAEVILGAIGDLHKKVDDNSKETQGRIDGLTESVGGVQVAVGQMTVKLDTVKEDVNGHLKDHKKEDREVSKERRQFKWGIVETAIAAVLTFGVLFLAYRLGVR